MPHARLTVEYDGTDFAGWSRQPGRRTIEQAFRDAFDDLSMAVDDLTCAGRTDSGVHATGQVLSVEYEQGPPIERLANALNGRLSHDVAVLSATPAPAGFDARADATWRRYEYRILTTAIRRPMRRARVLHHPRPLDLRALGEAAACIEGRHDFRAFTPTRTQHRWFRRTVMESRFERRDDELVYVIRADAFLRHMVRTIMGALLLVGRGEWPVERLAALLEGAERSHAHNTVPGAGLCLTDVGYDTARDPALSGSTGMS